MIHDFPAHIRKDGDSPVVQTVPEHCRGTAVCAERDLREIGLRATARLAGQLHDLGKQTDAFREYLTDAVLYDRPVRRGSVNHTFAGCRLLLERYHPSDCQGYPEITAELLAFAVAAHHGLFDCVNEHRESGFLHRCKQEGIHYTQAIQQYFDSCLSQEELDKLFQASVSEVTPVLEKISALAQTNRNMEDPEDLENAYSETDFYVGLLARMVLSAVIDGDRQDTAEFLENTTYPPPLQGQARQNMWQDCLEYMEQKLLALPQDTPIQRARRIISNQCAAFSSRPGGVYRLHVPTGGGKTLSSLRFALAHAAAHNKARIILTSSLLSVLDQNAKVIRDFIPDPSLILEHHSNVVRQKDEAEQTVWERMCAQWRAPIVITTLVQLLDTCFSGKTSCIRRFQALCNSVIVTDEIQTMPSNLLTLFNLAVNFLSEVCGATIVLCSATQPCLEALPHPLLHPPEEMVPYDEALWRVFRRTRIQNAGVYRLEELPAFAESILAEADSLLIVCNKKSESEALFSLLDGIDADRFHLSAAMCMAHRRAVLQQMQSALEARRRKVLCISTQVIEAGMDISFQRVIRFAAGMDSVVQAAGRCNRHGSEEIAPVYLVQCAGENLGRLAEIQRGQNATLSLLHRFETAPEEFQSDLSSDDAIRFYYQRLYRSMDRHETDDVIPERKCTLYDLLSSNEKYADENFPEAGRFFLRQSFKIAGNAFRVFDQNTEDVLAPYGEGKQLRSRLIEISESPKPWDYREIQQLLEQAKPFTVSLYQYQWEQLNARGALVSLFDGRVYALTDGFYNQNTGFSLKQWESDFMEG